jgi:voltage-gated sodium channel
MKHLQRLLLNDKFILGLIFLNAVIIFLQGFKLPKPVIGSLIQADNLITIVFIMELLAKLRAYGVKGYLSSNWNIFDAVRGKSTFSGKATEHIQLYIFS